MSTEYTPIKVEPKDDEEAKNEKILEIEIEEKEEDSNESNQEEGQEQEEKEGSSKKPVGRPKGSKNKKRDKRIKQLLDRAEQEAQRAEELEQKLAAMEAQLHTSSRSSFESKKDSLENQIDALTSQLKTAMEEEDSEAVVATQRKLMEATMQHASVAYQLENTPEAPEVQPKETRKAPKPSEYALDWVEEHPEFNDDVEFHQAALGANAKLLSEGFDPESPEFYEELDVRLSRRFPEFFDTDSENVVQSKKGTKNSNASELEDGTENGESLDDTDYPQTVAGASRTPSGSTPTKQSSRKTNPNIVQLSEQDVELCKQWGIDPKVFAYRKQQEQKKDRGTYTPIKIPNKNEQ